MFWGRNLLPAMVAAADVANAPAATARYLIAPTYRAFAMEWF